MPGQFIRRWTIGSGGFLGEVSLYSLLEFDSYVGADCELTNLYCHPLRRGNGWARELMDTALHYALTKELDVFLRAAPYGKVPADKDKLIKFYRSYGFRPLKRSTPDELILRW